MRWIADWNESQKEVHLTGFPLNWGREILGSFTLAPQVVPEAAGSGRSVAGGSVAVGSAVDGSVADESVADGSIAGWPTAGGSTGGGPAVGGVVWARPGDSDKDRASTKQHIASHLTHQPGQSLFL